MGLRVCEDPRGVDLKILLMILFVGHTDSGFCVPNSFFSRDGEKTR